MATRTLPAGTRFADWAWARNVIGPLQALDVHVGSRYLSPTFSPQITSGKCFSIPERNEGFAQGFAWLLNWESSASDALGGAVAGQHYGRMCYDQLRTLEYPLDPALKFTVSCDTDARRQLSSATDYFHAFQDACGEYGPQMNAYGGSYVLDALAWCGPHWLTTSHGWSDPAVWAAIDRGDWTNPILANLCAYQTSIGSTPSWDMDVIIKPVTVWSGLGADITPANPPATAPPVITPTIEEPDMTTYVLYRATSRPDALIAFDGSGASALINPGGSKVEDWGNTMLAYGPGSQQYAAAIDCTPEYYDGILSQCNNKRENAAITATIGVPNPLHVAVDSEPTRTTT